MSPRIICLFLNLFVYFIANGQSTSTTLYSAIPITKQRIAAVLPGTDYFLRQNHASALNYPSFTFMSSIYYTPTLSFFCRKEILVEKALKFPVKLRLGSVAYTDKMEGKGAQRIVIPRVN